MVDKKKKEDIDEITLAKDIFDEIVTETESEDWNKEKAASKTPPKKNAEKVSANQTH